ncbi:hypothetical protein PIB30_000431 [Stylosanthes scabra]|uniref:Uncharacterized protein n=1 Tax=Stylosanthes scabra TaxID=79078 RepID=A0ABU6V3V4_9FABA|nr:hypothetical protein [Stylosanthes scabra]
MLTSFGRTKPLRKQIHVLISGSPPIEQGGEDGACGEPQVQDDGVVQGDFVAFVEERTRFVFSDREGENEGKTWGLGNDNKNGSVGYKYVGGYSRPDRPRLISCVISSAPFGGFDVATSPSAYMPPPRFEPGTRHLSNPFSLYFLSFHFLSSDSSKQSVSVRFEEAKDCH